MNRKLGAALAAASLIVAGVAVCVPAARADSAGVKVGILTCSVDSGWGFVFGSSRTVRCSYSPRPNTEEHYTGNIAKYGVDIGYLRSAVMVWTVVAPTMDVAAGALAGQYAGVTGSASVGAGVGANVLVGGLNKSITLQPVSIEGNSGLNVAAGVESFTLSSAP
jgi:hypothetical protein